MSIEKTSEANTITVDVKEYPEIAQSIPRAKLLADRKKSNEERSQHLLSKDYLVTVITSPDKIMSSGDSERQIAPKRTNSIVSLSELPRLIANMNQPIWEHPKLKDDLSNAEDIPFEEKQWGIKSHMTIEPFTEELEKQYVQSSEQGFFKTWREVQKRNNDFISKELFTESEEL